MNNASSSFDLGSLADLEAEIAELERLRSEDDHKVFSYPGTRRQLRDALAKEGVLVGGFGMGLPLYGLEVVEMGGRCLIGTPAALRKILLP